MCIKYFFIIRGNGGGIVIVGRSEIKSELIISKHQSVVCAFLSVKIAACNILFIK